MPPAPLYVRTREPSRTLHTSRLLSNEPLASSWPLGEKATEYTGCVCRVSAKMHCPVSASHNLRAPKWRQRKDALPSVHTVQPACAHVVS